MSRRMARPRSAGPKLNVAGPCNAALVPFIEAKHVHAVLVAECRRSEEDVVVSPVGGF